MKIIKGLTVGLLVLICMAKVGTAGSIVYDFTGANTGTHDSLNLTVDGVSVNVTAWANMSAEEGSSPWFQVTGQNAGVYDGTTGLGVQMGNGSDSNYLDGQSGPADGIDFDEGLMFVFSEPVNLKSVDFAFWDSDDDFNLTIDGNDIFHDNGSDPFNADLPLILAGTPMIVWVDGASDEIRIQELTVEPVPEPATIAILSIGLIGIVGGTARRRLKKSKVS